MQTSNIERDCFLWEKMGRCYHEDVYVYFDDFNKRDGGGWQCVKCNEARHPGRNSPCYSSHRHSDGNPDFSTWDGFALLWNWTQKQIWIRDFEYAKCGSVGMYLHSMINPDNFANEIYRWLK